MVPLPYMFYYFQRSPLDLYLIYRFLYCHLSVHFLFRHYSVNRYPSPPSLSKSYHLRCQSFHHLDFFVDPRYKNPNKQQFFHHGSILPLKFITSRAGNGDSIVLSSYPSPGLEKVFPGTQSHSAGGAARRVRPHTAHCGSRCALHRSPAADVPR